MGGIGKTTLAKKIVNDNFIEEFDCVAWVDVSQVYNLNDLLMKIANAVLHYTYTEMTANVSSTEEQTEKLLQTLNAGLAHKKYFIVLDGVWETLLWVQIKEAFPENGKSSRVLLTSRFKEVAFDAGTRNTTYFLPILEENDSLKLFSRRVFHDKVCPPMLENFVKEEILSKCKGVPLAILVVAGLFKQKEQSMWSKLADDLSYHIGQNPRECLGILGLSYEELPPHLKSCFLYFGVFPEDFEIRVSKLIPLWVAEGFVNQDNDRKSDMEDVAEEYLMELIDRSLIQVGRMRTDGGVKTCRIHDLLLELSISKAKEEMFLSIDRMYDGSSLPVIQRRFSVNNISKSFRYHGLSEISQLRSILCLYHGDTGHNYSPIEHPLSPLLKFCPYLRVLNFDAEYFYKICPDVKNLSQLRYLRMNAQEREEIPSNISKFVHLQFYDVRSHLGGGFRDIWKMQQLRHLVMYDQMIVPKSKRNTKLPNLRTLDGFRLRDEDDVDILKMFPNLKKLSIVCRLYRFGVFEHLSELKGLQTLKFRGRFPFTDTGSLPSSITKIRFDCSVMLKPNFSILGGLPHLQILILKSCFFEENKLDTSVDQGQFPSLKYLEVKWARDLKSWTMEGQGLQSLVHLSIFHCDELEVIPDQLKQLSSLLELKIMGCHFLKERLEHIWGSDERLIIKSKLPRKM